MRVGGVVLLCAATIAHTSVSAQATTEYNVSTPSGNVTRRCFPPDFLFGSATASYQVEGGWNATGRTPSIWDDYCRAKPNVQCANVADDFVHRYAQDIDLMVATGLSSFRFSVSWSRVMRWDKPSQRMVANAEGIAFYHSVVDTLRLKGIVPILTLYHWDLPSALHTELSPPGWLNAGIVDHFVEYAELMYREFGAKVDLWSTFNEPWTFTTQGYGNGQKAPGFKKSATYVYTVAHNVLLSHGAAVKLFRQLKESNVVHADAKIGIVLNADFSYPLDPMSSEDVAAAERKMHFALGWFLTPIVSGVYPAIMQHRVGDRLPNFTDDQVALVKGSYDVLMLNHYSSKTVTDCASEHSKVKCSKQTLGWERDLGIDETRMPRGARPSSTDEAGGYLCTWFTGFPQGYLDTIRWMHLQDPTAPILLTENGWCGNSTIDNQDQLWYYQRYIEQVHRAITEENIPIIGYTAWSFVDNYEWGSFAPRFGLYYVDFPALTGSKQDWTPKDSDLKRIPRTAATWYSTLAKTKCMELPPEPPFHDSDSSADDDKPVLLNLVSKLIIAAVVVPMVIAAIAAVFVIRRRSALHVTEETPLLRP